MRVELEQQVVNNDEPSEKNGPCIELSPLHCQRLGQAAKPKGDTTATNHNLGFRLCNHSMSCLEFELTDYN